MLRLRVELSCLCTAVALAIVGWPAGLLADEAFVTIHQVTGNRMQITKDAAQAGGGVGAGRGRGMRGGGMNGAGGANADGFGRRRGGRGRASEAETVVVTVPASAKITAAMRERRTFEFRVLAELPGGLRHPTFQHLTKPLQARIVTKNNSITEVNVITGQTDINQAGTSADGQTVIAVRPKRPPPKRKP